MHLGQDLLCTDLRNAIKSSQRIPTNNPNHLHLMHVSHIKLISIQSEAGRFLNWLTGIIQMNFHHHLCQAFYIWIIFVIISAASNSIIRQFSCCIPESKRKCNSNGTKVQVALKMNFSKLWLAQKLHKKTLY